LNTQPWENVSSCHHMLQNSEHFVFVAWWSLRSTWPYSLYWCLQYLTVLFQMCTVKKGKAIPVTSNEGPKGCEMLKLPHFLDDRPMDGGEVVSLTHRLPFTPRKIPGTHFC
jgi:hypothetical protein